MLIHSLQYAGCLLALAVIVIVCNGRFPILRDLPAGPQRSKSKTAYSLARVQMAFWTVIVTGSIAYAYFAAMLASGQAPMIHESLVGLLGISGATGLAATAVDVSKDKEVEAAKAAFDGTATGVRALDAQIIASLSAPHSRMHAAQNDPLLMKLFSDKAAKMTELSQQEFSVTRSKRDDGSDGFISDLLTDQNGNSLHRLQLILFTLVFGTYFIVKTATDPASALGTGFSPQILGLMGVAGGVYAGYKLPGKAA